MVCPPSNNDDAEDKTTVLSDDEGTLSEELQKAKEQGHCLIVIRGKKQGSRFFITEPEMTVGRDPAVEISIDDPSISRKHAKIVKDGSNVMCVDLGSSNGTLVNGKKISQGESVKLQKEDMLKLGNCILKFLPQGELEILLYGNLESGAHTDAMTQIYNKGYLLEALEAEFKRARTLKNHFSVMFFDIDHFKKVNDTYGHDAGDYVLKELTSLIKSKFIGEKDVFARYGGEEFVVLLTNTDLAEGQKRAEEIRAAIESHNFIYEGKKLPIASSFGVAQLSDAMDSAATLMKCADKALYQSKEGGRNKVTVYSA